MRPIDDFIVHCSATPNDRDVKTETIKAWHTEGNGWSDIGYHFVIERDGSLHEGRKLEQVGAHVKGHNTRSIGVCMVGMDEFTPDQFATLKTLYKTIKAFLPDIRPSGHRDWTNAKTCPNFEVRDYL